MGGACTTGSSRERNGGEAALTSYVGLDPEYVHKVIGHAGRYAKGNVPTNGLGTSWSLFKRGIKGTHISVEPCHLFRYQDSECFGFNNRNVQDGNRFLRARGGVEGKRRTYKALIGENDTGPRIPDESAGVSAPLGDC